MKYILLLCSFLSLFSCGNQLENCNLLANACKADECLLIVQKIPGIRDGKFNYKGINPLTKKACDCNSVTSDRWWADYKEYIEIGDTLIKKKGELVFSIHKKDTVLSFNFECGEKVYK
ncbi:hypothetical protein [Flavobacterium sp. LHD-85]|uniref:hypothetical protein n=1 Tax=Flavobacterium sp. LHD-85 TaxID=3071410 RepID=UPI0027DED4BD|nr:hypothetical protein [Flavobacterium sp. LHD-85]MDQ6528086.1 hypothetical protein [Flavobacterium sp. LHD-85]